jgi:putative ABC transport system ATP-binding protein
LTDRDAFSPRIESLSLAARPGSLAPKRADARQPSSQHPPVVRAEHVHKTHYRGRIAVHALVDASLAVADGEFVAIMGPSGSGKSTLLNLIAGLDVPTGGTIHVRDHCMSAMTDDEATAFRCRHIGIVYQDFNLFPDLTIDENVSVPLLLAGRGRREIRERVAAVLDHVGIGDRARHFPTEVSGGELQRAAIARALVAEPAIMLADEPTGNLDSATAERILVEIRRAVDEQRRTVLMVTHDPRAAAYADRIARLRDGAFESA